MKIFYFTGTGNSLSIAKKIASEFEDSELIPIASIIKGNLKELNLEGTVGFVVPTYYLGFPKIVESFFSMINLNNTNYTFLIVTRGSQNVVNRFIGNILKRFPSCISRFEKIFTRPKLNAGFYIDMPFNDPIWAALPHEDSEREKILNSNSKIERIVQIIKYKNNFKEREFFKFLRPIRNTKFLKEVNKKDENFWITEDCNGCGICEKICPMDNIRIVEEKPVWQNKCEQCLACLNNCKVINVGEKTVLRDRYVNNELRVEDYLKQKLKV